MPDVIATVLGLLCLAVPSRSPSPRGAGVRALRGAAGVMVLTAGATLLVQLYVGARVGLRNWDIRNRRITACP